MKLKAKAVAVLSTIAFLSLGVYSMNATETEKGVNQGGSVTGQESEGVVRDDVVGHWAEKELKYFYDLGMIERYADGSLMPDEYMTKIKFLTLLIDILRLSGDAEVNILDVWESDPMYKDIKIAVANNVIDDGVDFRPYKNITAKEASDMLNRVLGNGEEIPYIKECIAKSSNYKPDDFITRATVAHTMYEVMQKTGNARSGEKWKPLELEYLLNNGYIDDTWSQRDLENKFISKDEFMKLATDALDVDCEFEAFDLDKSNITREEMAMLLMSLLSQKEVGCYKNINPEEPLVFDKDNITNQYYDSVMYVLKAGIMDVSSACDFNPKEEVLFLDALNAIYRIKLDEEESKKENLDEEEYSKDDIKQINTISDVENDIIDIPTIDASIVE